MESGEAGLQIYTPKINPFRNFRCEFHNYYGNTYRQYQVTVMLFYSIIISYVDVLHDTALYITIFVI